MEVGKYFLQTAFLGIFLKLTHQIVQISFPIYSNDVIRKKTFVSISVFDAKL